MTLHLILADSELELVPQPIQGHPAVVRHAKERGKRPSTVLLDANYHHRAIRVKYPDEAERRGRPDIVHHFLMVAMESVLNKEGHLRVYVHTRNDQVIFLDPEVRLPRAYHRFVGLMEALFNNKVLPDKANPLLTLKEMTLAELIGQISPRETVVLAEWGKRVNPREAFADLRDCAVIIGGFPHGDFLSDVRSIADRAVSIYDGTLMAWVAAYEVIASYESTAVFG